MITVPPFGGLWRPPCSQGGVVLVILIQNHVKVAGREG